jgi:hypothetical protein
MCGGGLVRNSAGRGMWGKIGVTLQPEVRSAVPQPAKMVGLTGVEPVTPRLSSVCSNQLSYRPALKSGGGMGIRTPDILLAKQVLYQLSYTPFL